MSQTDSPSMPASQQHGVRKTVIGEFEIWADRAVVGGAMSQTDSLRVSASQPHGVRRSA